MGKQRILASREHTRIKSFRELYMPVVEYALSHGCTYKYGSLSLAADNVFSKSPFATDKGGVTTCYLFGNITLSEILENFTFDDEVNCHEYDDGGGIITDPRHYLEIRLYPPDWPQ